MSAEAGRRCSKGKRYCDLWLNEQIKGSGQKSNTEEEEGARGGGGGIIAMLETQAKKLQTEMKQ